MTSMIDYIRLLLTPPPKPVPHDVAQLNEATKKLHASVRRVSREANAFGQMLNDMQISARKSRRVRR